MGLRISHDDPDGDAASMPRKLLHRFTSPIATAVILGMFALYALGMVLAFDRPLSDGNRDFLLPIGLISLFVGLMCLLVMFRAMRDGRPFEAIFVFFIVMPLNSMATQAAGLAVQGKPVLLDDLLRSSIYLNLQIFSPAMWAFLGLLGLTFVLAFVFAWRREKTAAVGKA